MGSTGASRGATGGGTRATTLRPLTREERANYRRVTGQNAPRGMRTTDAAQAAGNVGGVSTARGRQRARAAARRRG